MTQQIEMNFLDRYDEFIKLCEVLNTGDHVCPVFLAFDHASIPRWLLVTPTIRACLELQDTLGENEVEKRITQRIEKLTYIIRPYSIHWSPRDEVFVAHVDGLPF